MVSDAKDVALNINDPNAANKWRNSNNKVRKLKLKFSSNQTNQTNCASIFFS